MSTFSCATKAHTKAPPALSFVRCTRAGSLLSGVSCTLLQSGRLAPGSVVESLRAICCVMLFAVRGRRRLETMEKLGRRKHERVVAPFYDTRAVSQQHCFCCCRRPLGTIIRNQVKGGLAKAGRSECSRSRSCASNAHQTPNPELPLQVFKTEPLVVS